MINGRQLLEYLSANGRLTGVTKVTAPRDWGKARVTAGMTRRDAVPAKFRNGAGRVDADTGEFRPGLSGLSSEV